MSVQHAQKYRSWLVQDLLEFLSSVPLDWSVFPHPVTGNLIVVKPDGEWSAFIDRTGITPFDPEEQT